MSSDMPGVSCLRYTVRGRTVYQPGSENTLTMVRLEYNERGCYNRLREAIIDEGTPAVTEPFLVQILEKCLSRRNLSDAFGQTDNFLQKKLLRSRPFARCGASLTTPKGLQERRNWLVALWMPAEHLANHGFDSLHHAQLTRAHWSCWEHGSEGHPFCVAAIDHEETRYEAVIGHGRARGLDVHLIDSVHKISAFVRVLLLLHRRRAASLNDDQR